MTSTTEPFLPSAFLPTNHQDMSLWVDHLRQVHPLLLVPAATLLAGSLYFTSMYIQWHRSPLWKIPGPPKSKTSFLQGHFFKIISRPFMAQYLDWINHEGGLGKVDYIHFTELFGAHTVLVLDAEQIKTILFARPKPTSQYIKKMGTVTEFLGRGLVALEGNDWHRHRRLIHPSFQVSFLNKILLSEVPTRVNRFMEVMKQAGDREIDIGAQFSLLTLDIIGQVGFHHDFHGLKALEKWAADPTMKDVPETNDRLAQSLGSAFEPKLIRALLILFNVGSYRFFDRESHELVTNMNDAVDAIVAHAKDISNQNKTNDGSKSSSKYAAKSILELMFDATDSESNNTKHPLTDLELREEVKTFLVAGHETTSLWCTWAMYAMIKHPDIQQKLYDEIMSRESLETVDDFHNLTYLDAFMKEVLRFYPPVGFQFRTTTQTEKFGNYEIPPNTRVLLPAHLMHRSPKYWDDPETFLPERWMGDKPAHSHHFAYFPFSGGPRICIGYRFATLEAKMIMSQIIKEFRFELAPSVKGKTIIPTALFTTKPSPAVKILAKQRNVAGN